ncbi:LLM class flavin-dependent oxidoreductase [Nocardia sp. NPDC051832]|uniref:LLM class flavin-dependent oxidoreductase n=1 Tax=Nocardia sp. NPDC051832 TaxID=3155673 RepID=UPI003437E00B
MADSTLFLGVELAGPGIHPAAWRRADSRAEDLFTGEYWVAAVTAAETAGVDAAFLPDGFALQPGGPGVTRGRLDAVALAARVAAATHGIGLLPQAAVTHTEPFHLSKAIASLDFAALGRAGWETTVSETAAEANAFGRKGVQDSAALWHEADEALEVVTRLWDSWEDDAEIRDVGTGRFIDRDKLHYIDFAGDNFSVKGPSITPRPPQGRPIVAVRAADPASTAVAVRRADLIRITAASPAQARARRTELRSALAAAERDPDTVRVLLDLDVHLADSVETAAAEVLELDQWAAPASAPRAGTAPLRHLGTTAGLRRLLDDIAEDRIADGVVLRPLAVQSTLTRLAGLGRNPPAASSFRHRLGLPRPLSRYATAPSN